MSLLDENSNNASKGAVRTYLSLKVIPTYFPRRTDKEADCAAYKER